MSLCLKHRVIRVMRLTKEQRILLIVFRVIRKLLEPKKRQRNSAFIYLICQSISVKPLDFKKSFAFLK